MAGKFVNKSGNGSVLATSTDSLQPHTPKEISKSQNSATLPEIEVIKKNLSPESQEKLEQQVKLRYLSGSLQGIHHKLEMTREEEGVDVKLDQEIANVINKKSKIRSLIDSNWEVIKKELQASGKTDSEINEIEKSLQKVEMSSLADFSEYQKQHEVAQQAAQLKELNNKSWYQRIADPVFRVIYQSPELVRQQVGILYGGYRELVLGMYEAWKLSCHCEGAVGDRSNLTDVVKHCYQKGIERSGTYIENYRKQCEREKRTNGIGSVLGSTKEFSKGNYISDLITLHPITAYANPVMEVVDAIYDETLLQTTNTLTSYMGGDENLSYIELKKLQATDINFKTGKFFLDVAKISGSIALSPSLGMTQGFKVQAKQAGSLLKSNMLFSGVIATGTELKNLSLPSTEVSESKKFSLFGSILNIGGNTFTNTANSIGMAGTTDVIRKGYLGFTRLRLPKSSSLSSPHLALSNQLKQQRALVSFQQGNQLYQTIDDFCDFLDSAKDASLTLDVKNPLSIFGHLLVLGATTQDLMGGGANDKSQGTDTNSLKKSLLANADEVIEKYGDQLTTSEFNQLLNQKHEAESVGYQVDINNSISIELNGRLATAYYSLNQEVLYFDNKEQVAAYRDQRLGGINNNQAQDKKSAGLQTSNGVVAFYDNENEVIVAINPTFLRTEEDFIIHNSFLVHEIAHKKGLMSEYYAYIAQAQYLSENGYQMIFARDGSDYHILKSRESSNHISELPEYSNIRAFVHSNAKTYPQLPTVDSTTTTTSLAMAAAVGPKNPDDSNYRALILEIRKDDLDLNAISKIVDGKQIDLEELINLVGEDVLRLYHKVISELSRGKDFRVAAIIAKKLTFFSSGVTELFAAIDERLKAISHFSDKYLSKDWETGAMQPLEAEALNATKKDREHIEAMRIIIDEFGINDNHLIKQKQIIKSACTAYVRQLKMSVVLRDSAIENSYLIHSLFPFTKVQLAEARDEATEYFATKKVEMAMAHLSSIPIYQKGIETELLMYDFLKKFHADLPLARPDRRIFTKNSQYVISEDERIHLRLLEGNLFTQKEFDLENIKSLVRLLMKGYLSGEKERFYGAINLNIIFKGKNLPLGLMFDYFSKLLTHKDDRALLSAFNAKRLDSVFNDNYNIHNFAPNYPSVEEFRHTGQNPVSDLLKSEKSVESLCNQILNYSLSGISNFSDFKLLYVQAVKQAINGDSKALCVIRSIKQLAACEKNQRVLSKSDPDFAKLSLIYEALEDLDSRAEIGVPVYKPKGDLKDPLARKQMQQDFVAIDRISTSDLYTLREIQKLIIQNRATENDCLYAVSIAEKLYKLGISSSINDFFEGKDIYLWLLDNALVLRCLANGASWEKEMSLSLSLRSKGRECLVNSRATLQNKFIEYQIKLFSVIERTKESVAKKREELRRNSAGILGYYDAIEKVSYALSREALGKIPEYRSYSERLLYLFARTIRRHEGFHRAVRERNLLSEGFNKEEDRLLAEEVLAWDYTIKDFAKLNIEVVLSNRSFFISGIIAPILEKLGINLGFAKSNFSLVDKNKEGIVQRPSPAAIREWIRRAYRNSKIPMMTDGSSESHADDIVSGESPHIVNGLSPDYWGTVSGFTERYFQVIAESSDREKRASKIVTAKNTMIWMRENQIGTYRDTQSKTTYNLSDHEKVGNIDDMVRELNTFVLMVNEDTGWREVVRVWNRIIGICVEIQKVIHEKTDIAALLIPQSINSRVGDDGVELMRPGDELMADQLQEIQFACYPRNIEIQPVSLIAKLDLPRLAEYGHGDLCFIYSVTERETGQKRIVGYALVKPNVEVARYIFKRNIPIKDVREVVIADLAVLSEFRVPGAARLYKAIIEGILNKYFSRIIDSLEESFPIIRASFKRDTSFRNLLTFYQMLNEAAASFGVRFDVEVLTPNEEVFIRVVFKPVALDAETIKFRKQELQINSKTGISNDFINILLAIPRFLEIDRSKKNLQERIALAREILIKGSIKGLPTYEESVSIEAASFGPKKTRGNINSKIREVNALASRIEDSSSDLEVVICWNQAVNLIAEIEMLVRGHGQFSRGFLFGEEEVEIVRHIDANPVARKFQLPSIEESKREFNNLVPGFGIGYSNAYFRLKTPRTIGANEFMIENQFDKPGVLFALAQEFPSYFPATVYCASVEDLPKAIEQLNLPVYIKGNSQTGNSLALLQKNPDSSIGDDSYILSPAKGPDIIGSIREIADFLKMMNRESGLLVQEEIPIARTNDGATWEMRIPVTEDGQTPDLQFFCIKLAKPGSFTNNIALGGEWVSGQARIDFLKELVRHHSPAMTDQEIEEVVVAFIVQAMEFASKIKAFCDQKFIASAKEIIPKDQFLDPASYERIMEDVFTSVAWAVDITAVWNGKGLDVQMIETQNEATLPTENYPGSELRAMINERMPEKLLKLRTSLVAEDATIQRVNEVMRKVEDCYISAISANDLATRALATVIETLKQQNKLELTSLAAEVGVEHDLNEVLKRIAEVCNNTLILNEIITLSLKLFVSSLDRFSNYQTRVERVEQEKTSFVGIGVCALKKDEGTFIDYVYPDSPASSAGIERGDILLKINDRETVEMTLEEIGENIRGEDGTSVKVEIRKSGTELVVVLNLSRENIKYQKVFARLFGNTLAYFYISQFSEMLTEEFVARFNQLMASVKNRDDFKLIIDLRNNPGGLLLEAARFLDLFLTKGTIVSTKGREEEKKYVATEYAEKMPPPFPIIILVNTETASAAEIVAAVMQHYKVARIIGEETFGKNVGQTPYHMPDGAELNLTAFEFRIGNEDILFNGVTPDIEVKGIVDSPLNVALITQGPIEENLDSDPQLKAAMEELVKADVVKKALENSSTTMENPEQDELLRELIGDYLKTQMEVLGRERLEGLQKRVQESRDIFQLVCELFKEGELGFFGNVNLVKFFVELHSKPDSPLEAKFQETIFRIGSENFKQIPLCADRYQYLSYLGKGVEGVVFKVLDTKDSKIKALKFCYQDTKRAAEIWKEALAGREKVVQTENVGITSETGNVFVLTEFIDNPALIHRYNLNEAVALVPSFELIKCYVNWLEEVCQLFEKGIWVSDSQFFIYRDTSGDYRVKLFDQGFWVYQPSDNDPKKIIPFNSTEFPGFSDDATFIMQFTEIFKSSWQRITPDQLNEEEIRELLVKIDQLKSSKIHEKIFDFKRYFPLLKLFFNKLLLKEKLTEAEVREFQEFSLPIVLRTIV